MPTQVRIKAIVQIPVELVIAEEHLEVDNFLHDLVILEAHNVLKGTTLGKLRSVVCYDIKSEVREPSDRKPKGN